LTLVVLRVDQQIDQSPQMAQTLTLK
jgi:hypothetical protein